MSANKGIPFFYGNMEFLEAEISKLGIQYPEHFEFNGSYFRFGKNKKYSMIGNKAVGKDDKIYAWATLIDFSGEIEKKTFYNYKKKDISSKQFKNFEIKRIKKEDSKKHVEFTDYYNSLDVCTSHPYFLKKQTEPYDFKNFPIKVNNKLNLAIPMLCVETGRILGLEYITDEGKKFRAKGSKGGLVAYPASLNKTSQDVFLTEGIADAMNLFEASGEKVETYACFGIDNLVKTAKFLAEKDKNKTFYIMADQPSVSQLKAISKRRGESVTPLDYRKDFNKKFLEFINIFVVWPPEGGFNEKGDPLIKDFNDLYRTNPLALDSFIKEVRKEKQGIMLLGRAGNRVKVFSYSSKKEETIRETSKKAMLFGIAPASFWRLKFGTTQEKKIIEDLFSASRAKDYDIRKNRWGGAWLDNDNLVVNFGNGDLEGKASREYNYIPILPFEFKPHQKKLNENTIDFLKNLRTEYFEKQNYEHVQDGWAILAWAILSLVVNIVPTRFVLGFYGSTSLGKSENYNNLISPLQKKFKNRVLHIKPSSKFAFFKRRLRMGVSSVFMSEGQKKSYSEDFIMAVREAIYPELEGGIGQMTAGGGDEEVITPVNFMTAMAYNYRPAFEEADMARLYEVNFFSNEKNSQVSFLESVNFLKKYNLGNIGQNIVSYLILNYQKFIEKEKDLLYRRLIKYRIEGHRLNAIATLVAFYETLGVFNDDFIDKYIYFLGHEKQIKGEISDPEEDVLTALFGISVFSGELKKSKTLGEFLRELPQNIEQSSFFSTAGGFDFLNLFKSHYRFSFHRSKSDEKVYIALPVSSQLFSAMQKQGIQPDRCEILSRVVRKKFGLRSKNIRIRGGQCWAMLIPFGYFNQNKEAEKYIFYERSSF